MPQATFYQLSEGANADNTACQLACDAAANRQRVGIFCQNQQQAEAVDELLWQLPANRFVPHNLYGEGPSSGTPVEIYWDASQLGRRHLLINLSGAMLSAPQQFQNIIDFVPNADDEKQAARVRYKQYQQAGCAMQFKTAEE
mgnify:CR=1 FL=1|tara:strand:- start:415 stop:840 length:426 start_codon:yes stop_codon:yes gene_type:complete